MNKTETRRFHPCAQGQHQDCTGAYFARQTDDLGSYEVRVVCPCACHRQATLFAPVESRQRGLFRDSIGHR